MPEGDAFYFRVSTSIDNEAYAALDDVIAWLNIAGHPELADELTLLKISYSTELIVGKE